ncbi:MAG: hypothetical protein K8R39_01390 [Arcobacteraceae bacterium]|nr:hypothetical protein [Arcobacteraceae bacterium]
MRLNKIFFVIVLIFSISYGAKEPVNINFQSLDIKDLVKVTSKIIKKNILFTENINGKVDFISNKQLYKEDIVNVLLYVLESKGYTIVDNHDILRVVKINDAVQYNLPIYSTKNGNGSSLAMVTEVFVVEHTNVDYISSKIRHLISKSAKLVSDKNSNSIILTDFKDNIDTVKKIITLISKDTKKYTQNIILKNIQATTLSIELKAISKAIFDETIEKEKVDILVNKDTNSLMLVGKKSNVEFLNDYIESIDKDGSLIEKVVEVIALKNIEAKNLATTLNAIINNKKYKNTDDKTFISTDEELNSVILIGTKNEVNYFQELIDKLDKQRQQVFVQARIIEVSDTKTNNLGIQYGLRGFKSGGSGLATFSSALNGDASLSSVMDFSSIGSYGFDLGMMKNGLLLGATVNLLKQNQALDVVSEPSLLCINNKESSIYVGETKSIKTNSSTTDGGTTNASYSREDIGLTLKVKPRISNSNKVTLEITTILEDASQTQTNDQPDTSKKEVKTTAIVNDGESVIIGGLIKNKTETTENKVPLLGDIPLFGQLFKNNYEYNDKINLVVIITPYIVPKSEDLTYIRNKLLDLKSLEEKYTQKIFDELEKRKNEEKNDS